MNKRCGNVCALFVALVASFSGCYQERQETPTKGHVTVAVSESVYPVIKQEKQKFEELYQQARVELQVSTAREAIARLFNDSIKVIVASRSLNKEEREVAMRSKLVLGEYKIAFDGIAIIVNEQNSITQLRTTQLDSIYRGIMNNWKDVGGKQSPIEICLPSRNAATREIVGTRVLRGQDYAMPAKIAQSSLGMLQFVSDHPNSLGMIGVNWLSEKTDSVKVLALSDPKAPDSLGTRGQYFSPHQAHIYRGFYPLTKEIYIYSRADQYGVAAGFITFITSGPGQKIILNSGLVPATMPIRLVQLTTKDNAQ